MGLRGAIAGLFATRRVGESRYPSVPRVPQSLRTLAGINVTPDTAVTVAAVWACLRYLSQTIGVMPWHVMRQGRNGSEVAATHPVDWLLYKRPNPEWSAFQFRETLTHWALRWGNGYAEIERDGLGRPLALWPVHPERVLPLRNGDGLLFYRVYQQFIGGPGMATTPSGPAGSFVDLDAADMFHVRGFGEGPVGVNVMSYAAESIGWAKAAQLFGAAFFGNGMNVSAVVTSDKAMDETGMRRLRKMLDALYRGPRNAAKYAILDNGQKYEPITIEPEKAQFIATNQHLIEEVCRWFGVPPHKIAHLLRATFSNIEEQNIEVVVDSIVPWAKRFEEEADFKLFGSNRPGYYTKINLNALMRGNSQARAQFYQNMVAIGAFSPNMVLEFEDLPGIGPEGDKHVMQSQWTTLEMIGQAQTPPSPPSPPSKSSAPPPPTAADIRERAAKIALRRMAAEQLSNAA